MLHTFSTIILNPSIDFSKWSKTEERHAIGMNISILCTFVYNRRGHTKPEKRKTDTPIIIDCIAESEVIY